MKRFYLLNLIFFCFIAVKAENVANGGFEAWSAGTPTSWTISSTTNVTQDNSPHTGTYAARGTVIVAGSAPYINSLTFPVSTGYTYVNFYYKTSLQTGDDLFITATVLNSAGSTIVGTITSGNAVTSNTSVWKPMSIPITYSNQAAAAQAKVNFTMQYTLGSGVHLNSYFVIDDVTMSNTALIGIDEIEESTKLQIFPNPVHNSLKIKTEAVKPLQITLSDALGRVVLHRLSENPVNGFIQDAINTESLSSGLYFLMVTSDKKTLVRRVIVE